MRSTVGDASAEPAVSTKAAAAINKTNASWTRRFLISLEGLALLDFVGVRISISGRAALNHVADIDVRALHLHPALDNVCQKLTRAPDEGFALFIFICSRCLADEHQIGCGIAYAENQVF